MAYRETNLAMSYRQTGPTMTYRQTNRPYVSSKPTELSEFTFVLSLCTSLVRAIIVHVVLYILVRQAICRQEKNEITLHLGHYKSCDHYEGYWMPRVW